MMSNKYGCNSLKTDKYGKKYEVLNYSTFINKNQRQLKQPSGKNIIFNMSEGEIVDIIPHENEMMSLKIIDSHNNIYLSKPFPRTMLPNVSIRGQKVEVYRRSGITEGNDDGHFVLICVLGGPAVFGICLTIALILVSTPAY
jgi:hypothetical protein